MQKALVIAICVILLSGCAGIRDMSYGDNSESLSASLQAVSQADARNITNTGFFIQKGKISTTGDAGRINLLFTMKYVKPGSYLISLRSITGMEAFRVYLTEDTVLINDRLNQELLYGNPFDFERITGINPDLLKVSLGDFISGNAEVKGENGCSGNNLEVDTYYKGLKIKNIIDCNLEKVRSLELDAGLPGEVITVEYKKSRYDYYRVPRKVEIIDTGRKVRISIKIEKYICPWTGEIEFIPGSGYKIRSLI